MKVGAEKCGLAFQHHE